MIPWRIFKMIIWHDLLVSCILYYALGYIFQRHERKVMTYSSSHLISSHLNTHLMFPLFPESRKPIQNMFSGKKRLKNVTLQIEFYPCKLTNKHFPHMV